MKRLSIWLLTLTAFAFAACSNDPGGDDKNAIHLTPGTPTSYRLYADETSLSANISFSTESAWHATVSETRASEVNWITLSPDHGDAAGDYTVSITLAVNTSGANRKATVSFESGGTKVKITIEQQATTAEGDIPGEGTGPATPKKLISQIVYSYADDFYPEKETITFTYDDQNRITKIEDIYNYYNYTEDVDETYSREFLYEYGEGVIHVKTVYSPSSEDIFKDEPEEYTAYLNKAGYVIRTAWEDGSEITYTYDDENHLILTAKAGGSQETYVWENGNIVETCTTYPDYPNEEPYVNRYAYYGEHPNKENFELYYYYFAWDEELGIAGRLGVLNRNLLKQVRSQGSQAGKNDRDITYEFDDEGFVTKFLDRYSETSTPQVYTVTYIEAK